MIGHPTIYEINSRPWFKRMRSQEPFVDLSQVPDSYWLKLRDRGIDLIWLMGVWQVPGKEQVKKYCFEEGLVEEYKKALSDWREGDVVGSPYAVDRYVLNESLGCAGTLSALKRKLNNLGLKLILDFVPNHFHAETFEMLRSPDAFLLVNRDYAAKDPVTFYNSERIPESYFAHGRDPYFPAWQDTVQVNYFSDSARKLMTDILLDLANVCDGIRCDMAMLALNDVFQKTWGSVLNDFGYKRPETEFWESSIRIVKEKSPNFLFIAEAYWDMEGQLQNLGFDFTYDKSLRDRLEHDPAPSIREHLKADLGFQKRSVRFLENHDETRAASALGGEKSKAAAVIVSTIPGMCFLQDGQLEGKTIRLPVQLGREAEEEDSTEIKNFYERLLNVVREPLFKDGYWKLLQAKPLSVPEGDHNILVWEWSLDAKRGIVAVNYSEVESKCHLPVNTEGRGGEIEFVDRLESQSYVHSRDTLMEYGLYVELAPFQSHIFLYYTGRK